MKTIIKIFLFSLSRFLRPALLLGGITFHFCLLSQDLPEQWFVNGNIIQSPIVSTSIDLTTGAPLVRYTDLYVHLEPPMYFGFLGENTWVMNDSMPDWSIEWDMRMTSFAGQPQIFGRNLIGSSITECYYASGEVRFLIKDTVRTVYALNGNTDWHSYKIMWDSSASDLIMVVDGNVTNTYHTTIPNLAYTSSPTLFAWGSRYQFEGQTLSVIVTDGGKFTGDFDNIRLIRGGDTTNNVNFNNGVIMLDKDQWYEWPNQTTHNYRMKNAYGGYQPYAVTYYSPQFVNRNGTVKDTLKYYQYPEYSTDGGGFMMQTEDGVGRCTINDADVRGEQILVGGLFNRKASDTFNSIGNNIARWDGSAWQPICDTGLAAGSFVYRIAWINDTAGACSILKGGRYITIFNTTNSNNWTHTADTIALNFEIFRDTLWFLDGKRLKAIDVFTKNVSVKKIFSGTYNADYNNAIGRKGDTLIVSAGQTIYYLYNNVTVETHTLLPYTAPDKLTVGGLWYKGIYAARDSQTVFIGGNFKGWDNIESENIGYIRNGVFHSMGNLGGATGNCNDYNLSCLEGAYTSMVTCFAEPYDGELVITGSFRKANGVPIGSNIIFWNATAGFRTADYGTAFTCWTARTLEKDGYTRLVFTGDGKDAGGMYVGNVWGRYLDEEFRTLTPRVTVTAVADKTPNDFPLAITANTFSKQQRQTVTKLIYHKNYNGTNDTVTMSKTDSSLTPILGGWDKDYTGNISGSYIDGDTIYVSVTSTDDYGNIGTASTTIKVVAPAPPTGIYAMWDWTDKADSFSVGTRLTTWTDEINGFVLTQSTTSLKPVMASNGILFDTISVWNTTALGGPTSPGLEVTVLIQMKITDTNSANAQRIFSYRIASPLTVTSMQIQTHAVSTYRKLGVSYYNNSFYRNRTYLTNWGNNFNTFSVFAVYSDSANQQSFRINDTIATDQGAAFSTGANTVGFTVGNSESTGGMKNAVVKRVWVWRRKLTYTELQQAKLSMVSRP